MSLKSRIKQFVPPALLRLYHRRNYEKYRSLATEQTYSVDYWLTKQAEATFFVPKYADLKADSAAILYGDLFEPQTHKLIQEIFRHRGGDMIHAGAFFGDMLPSFSRACPGTVYAFEPVLESYLMAKLCIEANQLGNVYIMNAGLGAEKAIARLNTSDEAGQHMGGSSEIGGAGQFASLIDIDSLELADLAVIQLDVEGYELHALTGARRTIARLRPIIMIEDNRKECAPLLDGLGYAPVGEIPGLTIWTTGEDREFLTGLLAGIGAA